MDAAQWDERYEGSDLIWTATPNMFVVEATDGLAPGRVLDLAGGEGRNAVWLAESGWSATVADFSPVGLEKALALAESRGVSITTIEADAVTWDPPIEAFDLVLVLYLQIPGAERDEALRRAAKAVAAGGQMLVVAHHTDNVAHGHGGPPSVEVCYSEADIVAAVPDLKVMRAECRERLVSTSSGEAIALDAVVLLSRT